MKLSKVLAAAAVSFASQFAWAGPSVSFFMNGDTFTSGFSIVNTSTADNAAATPAQIVGFHLDLSKAQLVFDTNIDPIPGCPNTSDGTNFQALAGMADTQWVETLGPKDCTAVLDLAFADFDSGEQFSWKIDIDGALGDVRTVVGSMLIGAEGWVDYSDGTRLRGVMADPDRSITCATYTEPFTGQQYPRPCSTFVVTSSGPIDGGGGGNNVPEPGSLALAGLGLLAAAGALRRAKRA